MRRAGVDVVEADQCMFGWGTWGITKSQLTLAKKPTRVMTNSRSMGQELKIRFDGAHEHHLLMDGRANYAVVGMVGPQQNRG